MIKRIVKNQIKCKKCGDLIESVHVHDYKRCSCGAVAVDGGKEYMRRAFPGGMSPEDSYEELSEYEVEGDE